MSQGIGLEDHLAHVVENLLVARLAFLQGEGGAAGCMDVGDAADHAQRLAVFAIFDHVALVAYPQVVAVGMAEAVFGTVAATTTKAGVDRCGPCVAIVVMNEGQEVSGRVVQVLLVEAEHLAPARVVGDLVGGQVPVPHAFADGGQHVGQLFLTVLGGRLLAHPFADVAGEAEGADDLPVATAYRGLEGFEPGGCATIGDLFDACARPAGGDDFGVFGPVGLGQLLGPQIQVGLADQGLGRSLGRRTRRSRD